MSELVDGDDGLPADQVGAWVADKHRILKAYLDYQAHARVNFLGPRRGGAAYIDVFCGPGRSRIRNTNTFVDGSPVVAWKASVDQQAPFTKLYIADKDTVRRDVCAERLRRLNAPVVVVDGEALEAARSIAEWVDQSGLHGLHFAFVDPYSLGALRLELLKTLSQIQRIDLLVHLSAMDLFRNLDVELAGERAEFDAFAPGWRDNVPDGLPMADQRRAAIDYWKHRIDEMGMAASSEMHAIRNSQNRDLYWLLMLSRHQLAQKFWKIALNQEPQRGFADF